VFPRILPRYSLRFVVRMRPCSLRTLPRINAIGHRAACLLFRASSTAAMQGRVQRMPLKAATNASPRHPYVQVTTITTVVKQRPGSVSLALRLQLMQQKENNSNNGGRVVMCRSVGLCSTAAICGRRGDPKGAAAHRCSTSTPKQRTALSPAGQLLFFLELGGTPSPPQMARVSHNIETFSFTMQTHNRHPAFDYMSHS
jgi:hypothetical protein